MGFYIVAKNKEHQEFAAISYQVWNPNVKHLFFCLGLEIPGEEDWSGSNEDKLFSINEINNALTVADSLQFFVNPQYNDLHPIVQVFTRLQSPELNPVKEKESLKRFFFVCQSIAKADDYVIINFR